MILYKNLGYDIKEVRKFISKYYSEEKAKEFDGWMVGKTGALYKNRYLVYKTDFELFLSSKDLPNK